MHDFNSVNKHIQLCFPNLVPRTCATSPSNLRTRMPYVPQQVVGNTSIAKRHVPGVAAGLQMYEQSQFSNNDDFQGFFVNF